MSLVLAGIHSHRTENRAGRVVAKPPCPLTAMREGEGVPEVLYAVGVLTYPRQIACRGEVMVTYKAIKECQGASSCGRPEPEQECPLTLVAHFCGNGGKHEFEGRSISKFEIP